MEFPIIPFAVRSAATADGVVIVTATGELDLHARAPFARELLAARGRGATTLLVDVLGVSFLDSTAVGLLAATARDVNAEGGRVVVVTDSPHARRVFELTGLTRHVDLERTLSGALETVEAVA